MAVSTKFVTTIRDAWNQLHGVLCVYKPTGLSCSRLKYLITNNIVRDINQLEPSKPRTYINIEPDIPTSSITSGEITTNDCGQLEEKPINSYSVSKTINMADLALVNGPAIIHDDIKMCWANPLGWRSSGVMVFGINKGNKMVSRLIHSRPLSVYQIKSQFGLATDNHWVDGKVWEKTTFHHLSKGKLDRILSSIQASNQKNMFRYCGVDPTSQTAYELASKGLLRPAVKGPTLVYSIKCILFEPPNFTLEIHCINESEEYLSTLIHDLGLVLKTNAACEQIRRVRYGCFTVEDSLLRKHWSLEHIPLHMSRCVQRINSLPEVTPNLTAMVSPGEKPMTNSDDRM